MLFGRLQATGHLLAHPYTDHLPHRHDDHLPDLMSDVFLALLHFLTDFLTLLHFAVVPHGRCWIMHCQQE